MTDLYRRFKGYMSQFPERWPALGVIVCAVATGVMMAWRG